MTYDNPHAKSNCHWASPPSAGRANQFQYKAKRKPYITSVFAGLQELLFLPKDRYVCRSSRENGVHEGYDRWKQAVKMADVYEIEKVWTATYEGGERQHGDFASKKSNSKWHRIF